MNKRILLTGGSGFVGRQILSALAKDDSLVRLVLRRGSEQAFKPSSNLEMVLTDDLFAENTEWWGDVCDGVDTVVHAAWYAEPAQYMQSPKNLDCLMGTLSLASACIQKGVRRLVGIGTCAEYDMSAGYLSIDTPLKPTSCYAGAKAAVFLSLNNLLPAQGIEFAWCRLFYLYGEGEDSRRLVPYLRARLSAGETVDLTSGVQIRDYLDVRKAGSEIAAVALGTQTGPINICSGTPQTVRELAEKIADEYGRRDLLNFGARPDNFFDPPCVVGVK